MHSALSTLNSGLWTLESDFDCGSSRKASIIPSSWAFWGLHVASMTTECWMANPLWRQKGSAINLSGLRNWAFLKGPPLRRQGVGRLEVRLDTCWSTATIEIHLLWLLADSVGHGHVASPVTGNSGGWGLGIASAVGQQDPLMAAIQFLIDLRK